VIIVADPAHDAGADELATITIVAGGAPPADHRAVIAALIAQGSIGHRTLQDEACNGALTTGAAAPMSAGVSTSTATVSAWRAAGIAEATTHFPVPAVNDGRHHNGQPAASA